MAGARTAPTRIMTKKRLVTIGLVQMTVGKDKNATIAKAERMVRQAAKKGAKIISLGELFATPYFPQVSNAPIKDYHESIPGQTTRIMSALAKELRVTIIVPMFEKGKGKKGFNTAVVFDDRGKMLGKYHKAHIPHDPGFYEKDYFEHGSSGYTIFKTKFGKFAVLICYDQWFPEAAREARLNGAEMIFYPTAAGDILGYKHPNDWHDAWETIQRSHAIANSVVVAVVNRVGVEGRTRFWGQSFVADAWGEVLKKASKDKEEVLVVEADLEYNNFLSEGWGFLRNRRPDTYKTLTTNKLVEKHRGLKGVAHYKAEIRALEKK